MSTSTVIYQKVNYYMESPKCQPKTQNDQWLMFWWVNLWCLTLW